MDERRLEGAKKFIIEGECGVRTAGNCAVAVMHRDSLIHCGQGISLYKAIGIGKEEYLSVAVESANVASF
jgi:hypothetical protein